MMIQCSRVVKIYFSSRLQFMYIISYFVLNLEGEGEGETDYGSFFRIHPPPEDVYEKHILLLLFPRDASSDCDSLWLPKLFIMYFRRCFMYDACQTRKEKKMLDSSIPHKHYKRARKNAEKNRQDMTSL